MKPSPTNVAKRYARILNPETMLLAAVGNFTSASRELDEAAKFLKVVRSHFPVARMEMQTRSIQQEAKALREETLRLYHDNKEEEPALAVGFR